MSKMYPSNCNIGLAKNKSNESAIRFNGLNSASWSMYLADKTGNKPNNKTPGTHGDVTGSRLRMRLGDPKKVEGLIIENNTGAGVVSVSSAGQTTIRSGNIGNITGSTTAYSHVSKHKYKNYAIAQTATGATHVKHPVDKT